MGLLDSMFGGGTNLTLALDRPTGSPGGVVGGMVQLTGGKKPLKLTKLRAHLIYVSVQSAPTEGGFPKIDTRVLGEQTLAAGIDLPPGVTLPFTFRLTLPQDTLPSAHNVTYKIQAVADIPGVKDPSADVDFKVVPADADAHRSIPLDEIYRRFPKLQTRDEDTLCEGLNDIFLDCYSNAGQYMEAEPMLAHYMQTGSVRVRRNALQAWANLVDNRVQPQHLRTLYAVANLPGLDQETYDEVIKAGCKFAEEGALPMVQHLASSPDPRVRKVTAENLRFNAAARFQGKRELLMQLAQDPDPAVRAAAMMAFGDYRDDAQIVYGVANQTDTDPSPEVQAACINTLNLVHHNGYGDLAMAVYEKHASNPSEKVREAVAENLHWQPEAQVARVWAVAQKLLQDPSVSVRRAMAFQFCNMERFPQLLPLVQQAAEQDPSPEVRVDAIRGMARITPVRQLMAYYGHKLAQNPPHDMLWAMISGLRDHNKDREAQSLLTRLGQHPDADIANAARDALN